MKVIVVIDDDGHRGVLFMKQGLPRIINADILISVRGRGKLIKMMEKDPTRMVHNKNRFPDFVFNEKKKVESNGIQATKHGYFDK